MVVKLPRRVAPLTHRDLPDSNEEIVQNPYQMLQASLLSSSIRPLLDQIHGDEPYLLASDVGIYWAATDRPSDGCKVPDWFYVPGASVSDPDGEMIRSYVIWSTNIRPSIVMEFVSGNGEEERDQTPGTGKFWVYENGIGAKYYVIFDPFQDGEIEVFQRPERGGGYRPVPANERGRYPISELHVELGKWRGVHDRFDTVWLRFFDGEGNMLLSAEERANREQERATAVEAQVADIRAKLIAKGIDPDTL